MDETTQSIYGNGDHANDRSDTLREGFRVDWDKSERDHITLQGDFYDGHSGQRNLMTSPGVHQEGLLGYLNPANLGMLNRFESRFAWSTDGTDATSINDWGLFTGAHNFGFGLVRQHLGVHVVTDYRLSIAMGNRGNSFGLSYGWSSGDTELVGRKKLVSAGWIFRPTPPRLTAAARSSPSSRTASARWSTRTTRVRGT